MTNLFACFNPSVFAPARRTPQITDLYLETQPSYQPLFPASITGHTEPFPPVERALPTTLGREPRPRIYPPINIALPTVIRFGTEQSLSSRPIDGSGREERERSRALPTFRGNGYSRRSQT